MTKDKQQLPSKEELTHALEIVNWVWKKPDDVAPTCQDYVEAHEVLEQAAQYVLTNHDELRGRE